MLQKDQNYDYHYGAAFLAEAYGKAGRTDAADAWYREALTYLNTPEILFTYAVYLLDHGRRDEAREWAQKVLDKKKTLPRYMQRIERPWFHRAKALLKSLQQAKAS